MDPLSGCLPHWEKQLAAARREGVIEGLEWALACVDTRGQQTRPLLARVEILRAELERLREEKP